MRYALPLAAGLAQADPAALWLNEPGAGLIQIAPCDGGTVRSYVSLPRLAGRRLGPAPVNPRFAVRW
jgi:hypothetical protein